MLKNRILKIWLIIMAVLCLAFVIVNAIWLLKIKLPYDHYKAIIRAANSSTWDYTMGINAPENLHVIEAEGFDESYLSKKQEYIDENYDYLNDILTYGLDTWGIKL